MDSANTLLRIQIKRTYRSPLFLWESSTSLHNAKESSPPTDVTSAGWINAMNASTSEATPYLLPPAPYRKTNQIIYQWETLEVLIICSLTFPSLFPGRLFGLHTNTFCIWIFSIKMIYLFWNETHNTEWSLSTRKRLKSYNTLKRRGVNISLWVFQFQKGESLHNLSSYKEYEKVRLCYVHTIPNFTAFCLEEGITWTESIFSNSKLQNQIPLRNILHYKWFHICSEIFQYQPYSKNNVCSLSTSP